MMIPSDSGHLVLYGQSLVARVEADLCRFEDYCVSSCQAGCRLPGQHHQRVVPGNHNSTHSEKKEREGGVKQVFVYNCN